MNYLIRRQTPFRPNSLEVGSFTCCFLIIESSLFLTPLFSSYKESMHIEIVENWQNIHEEEDVKVKAETLKTSGGRSVDMSLLHLLIPLWNCSLSEVIPSRNTLIIIFDILANSFNLIPCLCGRSSKLPQTCTSWTLTQPCRTWLEPNLDLQQALHLHHQELLATFPASNSRGF